MPETHLILVVFSNPNSSVILFYDSVSGTASLPVQDRTDQGLRDHCFPVALVQPCATTVSRSCEFNKLQEMWTSVGELAWGCQCQNILSMWISLSLFLLNSQTGHPCPHTQSMALHMAVEVQYFLRPPQVHNLSMVSYSLAETCVSNRQIKKNPSSMQEVPHLSISQKKPPSLRL